MNSKPESTVRFIKLVASLCLAAAWASSASASDITKASSGTDLTAGASWTGGTAPGAGDNAVWSGSSLGPGLTLGSPETWGSITVSGASGDIAITGAGALTNGNITLAGVNMTLGVTNVLSGNPIWTANGKTLSVISPIVFGANILTLAGTGTTVFSNNVGGVGYPCSFVVSNTTAVFVNVTPGGAVANGDATGRGVNFTNVGYSLLEFSNSVDLQLAGGTITGYGILLKQSAPGGLTTATVLRLGGNGLAEHISLSPGSLVDVENGTMRNEYGVADWAANQSSLYVNTNALFDIWDQNVTVDALNGYGTISKGWNGNQTLAVGVANGTGTFYGAISNNFTYTGYGSGGGSLSLVKLGTGTETLDGTNTYTGSTTVSNGTLVIGGAGRLGLGNYPGALALVQSTSIFNYASSQNQTNTGAISGAGQLIVSGAGSLTLTGDASGYTGNTTISGAGSLIFAGSTAVTFGGNISGGGTGILELAGSGVTTISGVLSAAAVVTNGGALGLVSTQTGTGAVTMYDGCKLTMTASGASQWAPASLTLGSTTLNFNGVTNSGTATAPIKPVSLTRNGAVTVNVSSTADPNIAVGSSYPLVANWGVDSGYTLGAQPLGWVGHLTAAGGTLKYVVDLQYDIWNNASLNSVWDILTSANWMGHATLNTPAGSYKDGDNVLFNDASVTSNQTITVSGVVSPAAIIAANNTNAYTIQTSAGNDIAGAGGLTKLGTGSLTLSGGVNTYSGATTISAGTMNVGVLANNNAPSDLGQPNSTDPGYLVLNGGALNYGGVTAGTDRGMTVGASNGTLGVTNGSSTLTLNGVIAGPGLLTKTGNGTLLLNNSANTYSGGTTVGGGTLQFGSAAALGAGTNVNVSAGATLDVAGQTLPSSIALNMVNQSTLKNSGAATTNYAKISFPTPANQVNNGLSDGGIILAGNSSTIYWFSSGGYPDWDCTNNISGTLDLAGTNDNSGMMLFDMGGGTVLLDKSTGSAASAGSANSVFVYNGGLVREAGNQGHQLYSGGQILIDNGGTFDLNGMGEMSGGLNSDAGNTNGLLVNNGAALSRLALAGSGTYYGIIKDGTSQIAIVKTNSGTENLSGTNLFTGGIFTYGGTLTYGYGEANSPIFNYPVTLIGGTANFNLSGNYTWNNSTISGTAGSLGVDGTNMVLSLATETSFAGNVAVNAGTFQLTGDGQGIAMIGGGITIANDARATFIAHGAHFNYITIGGSLNCGANGNCVIDYDQTDTPLQMPTGGITANSSPTLHINVIGSPLGINTYTLMTATNAVGAFNPTPDLSGGLGLSSPSLTSYISTSASGTVTLNVVQAYVWNHDPAVAGSNLNWSYRLNWDPFAPTAAGQLATLGTESSFTAITLDQAETIGALLFNNVNSFGIVGANTLTLDNLSAGVSIAVSAGKSNSIAVPVSMTDASGMLGVNVSAGSLLTLSGNLSGNAALTMNGGGTLVLSGANNTYNGGTTIGGGTLKLGSSSALGTFPTNTVNSGGTLDLNGQTLNQNITATSTNTIMMPGGGFLINSSASPAVVHSTIMSPSSIGWTIGGSGNIALDNVVGPGYPNWYITNNNTGTVDFDGTNDITGGIPVNMAGTLLLDVKGTGSFAGGAELHAASSLMVLGGLVKWTGTGGGQIWTGGTLTLGGGKADLNGQGQRVATFTSGGLGVGILTNSQAGTMATLTNNGGTFYGTVGGNLALNYTASATLGGNNLFWGGLNVNAGTLTVSNTLAANLPVNVASGAMLNLQFGVTNLVGSLVLGGATQATGIYSSNTAPAYITGPGALSVVTVGPVGPATLTNSVTGNVLSLTWPAGLGWRLVSQTNNLSTGLNPSNAAWGTVPGAGDGSMTITLNPTNPAVFYKLVYP